MTRQQTFDFVDDWRSDDCRLPSLADLLALDDEPDTPKRPRPLTTTKKRAAEGQNTEQSRAHGLRVADITLADRS